MRILTGAMNRSAGEEVAGERKNRPSKMFRGIYPCTAINIDKRCKKKHVEPLVIFNEIRALALDFVHILCLKVLHEQSLRRLTLLLTQGGRCYAAPADSEPGLTLYSIRSPTSSAPMTPPPSP